MTPSQRIDACIAALTELVRRAIAFNRSRPGKQGFQDGKVAPAGPAIVPDSVFLPFTELLEHRTQPPGSNERPRLNTF